MNKLNLTLIFTISFALMFPAAFLAIPASSAATCTAAGSTGLNASVIAVSNQVYTGAVVATGCDVGIYIGPGVTGVVITNANITGANDHGIFAQDTSNITVSHSTITGNGLSPHTCKGNQTTNCIHEDKAVQFVGVNSSIIVNNNVSYNRADGGIAIADDGVVDSGAIASSGSTHYASSHDTIANNYIAWNDNGCGIVIAGYDSGTSTIDIVAKNNTVYGNSIPLNPPHGAPAIGQIVLATDMPGSTVTGTVITNNTLNGSLPPGIVIHSNAPGDVIVNTTISANVLINNGDEAPPSPFYTVNSPIVPTGIAVMSESFANISGLISPVPGGPQINTTVITGNTVYGDVNAVWVCNAANTTISSVLGNSTNQVSLCTMQFRSEVNAPGLTIVGGISPTSSTTTNTTSSVSTTSSAASTTTNSTASTATNSTLATTSTTTSSSSSSLALSPLVLAPILIAVLVMIGAFAFVRSRKSPK
ncbi:MAG: right-handed parallel beta-helix repeat-containing protein [Nitrososphaerales archaeon]